MVVEGVVDVIFARVVVIELAVDVVLEVLVSVVHPVVHDGNVDPLSLDSLFPDRLDVDVVPLGAAQVPLARVQGVADRWVVQRSGIGRTVSEQLGVIDILVQEDRVRNRLGRSFFGRGAEQAGGPGAGHLKVVGALLEVLGNLDAYREQRSKSPQRYWRYVRRHLVAVSVEQGRIEGQEIRAPGIDDHMLRSREVEPEVVHAVLGVDRARVVGTENQGLRRLH